MHFHRHRNSQKRIDVPDMCYFITSVTANRTNYFRETLFCELLIEDFLLAREIKQMDLRGFTVIPNHTHLMFVPMENEDYSRVMATFKRNVSRDINDLIAGRSFIRNLVAVSDSVTSADEWIIPAGDDSNRRLRENFERTRRKYPFSPSNHMWHIFAILNKLKTNTRINIRSKGPSLVSNGKNRSETISYATTGIISITLITFTTISERI